MIGYEIALFLYILACPQKVNGGMNVRVTDDDDDGLKASASIARRDNIECIGSRNLRRYKFRQVLALRINNFLELDLSYP